MVNGKKEEYNLSLGVTRKELVNNKYVISMLLVISTTYFNFVASFGMVYIVGMNDYANVLAFVVTIVGVSTLQILIFIPLLFKYGTEKVRMLFMALGVIPFIFVFIAQYFPLSNFTVQQIESFITILPLLSILLLAVIAVISFYSSHKILKIQEF